MIKKHLLAFSLLVSTLATFAQDTWTVSEQTGFGNTWDEFIHGIIAFKGKLYVSTGNDNGRIFTSSSGSLGTWSEVFNAGSSSRVSGLSSTAEGGGYLYATVYSFGIDSPRVYRSFDGTTWTPYLTGISNEFVFTVPFKGTGSVDSMYVIEYDGGGANIYRSAYDSNDPNNLMGSWQWVADFDGISSMTNISSVLVHSGRFFVGTSDAQLFYSDNGTTWMRNDSVDFGFGDSGNYRITAMEAFGGYIYVGTENFSGAQLWRTSDQLNWSLVNTYGASSVITDLEATPTELWVAANNMNFGGGFIERSTDGVTFNLSSNDGFNINGNQGNDAKLCLFGNNMYYGTRNFFSGAVRALTAAGTPESRGGGMSTGGQVWRNCLITPPTLNLGNDTTICDSETITLNGGAGLSYYWNTADTTQTVAVGPGFYTCQVATVSGCDALDQITISGLASPNISCSPLFGTDYYMCEGGLANLSGTASSGLFNLDPPMIRVTHDTINDILGDNFDTLAVAGIPASIAGERLISITIDSIRHTYTGDVLLGLYSPSGDYIDLVFSGYGGGADNGYWGTEFRMDASNYLSSSSPPFTGSFQPDGSFSVFTGSPNGNWVVRTRDQFGGDEGNLLGWTLKFGTPDSTWTISWTGSGLTSSAILAPNVTASTTQYYALSVTNAIGCTTTDSLRIVVPEIDVPATATVCYGGSYTVTATGASGMTTTWFPATDLDVTTGATVTTSATSNILYYVTDNLFGCPVIDSIYVTADPQLFASAPAASATCFGDSVLLTASPSGGTPGYTYNWNDGSVNFTTQTIICPAMSGTSYTLTVTDTLGCTATDNTSVTVFPSTDLRGNVTYSGGPVVNGNVVAFQYIPTYTKFDTIQVTPLNATGEYVFTMLPTDNYLIKVFPDTLIYPALNSTYYGDVFAWDSATVVSHGCSMADTADIIMVEESGFVGGGIGFLRGRITEDVGFGRTPGDPIPGLDVKLGKNPGGAMVTSGTTNSSGYYTFTNVDFNTGGENYVIYVDIPGLGMDSSYTFVVDATTSTYLYLDYIVDSTTIYIVPNAGVGISNPAVALENNFNVYPNPSHGETTVEFTLPDAAEVILEVYNILGEKISTIINGTRTAGNYTQRLDDLRPGVYFVNLSVNGNNTSQRVVVME